MKEGGQIKQKERRYIYRYRYRYIHTHTHTYTHRHRQRCGDSQREEAGVSGAGRDFAGGNGYTMQYADGVLLSCILATCMVL